MSKFCVNCGTQLPEGTNACPNCGNGAAPQKVEKEKKAGNGFFAKVKAAFKKGNDAVAAKLKTFGIPMKAFYIALAAILVLVVVVSIFANAYKTPIQRYLDIEFKGKVQKIEKMIPKAYLEALEDEDEDFDADDYVDEMIEDAEESWKDEKKALEKTFGDNYKVSYKILYQEKIKGDDLDDVKDAINSKYDIAKSSIKTVYELYVKITIKGSEEESSYKQTFYSINIDGSWYLFSASGTLPYR